MRTPGMKPLGRGTTDLQARLAYVSEMATMVRQGKYPEHEAARQLADLVDYLCRVVAKHLETGET